MGREVRRVPPNWQHPVGVRANGRTGYMPMFDRSWDEEVREWKEGFLKWESGLRPVYRDGRYDWQPKDEWEYADTYADRPDLEWWGYHGDPPDDRDMYRPYTDAEATAYQVYETVSEGTPVSPVFADRESLIEWLVNDGSGMGVGGRTHRMSRQAAEAFAGGAYAPSMIVTPEHGVQSGVESLENGGS